MLESIGKIEGGDVGMEVGGVLGVSRFRVCLEDWVWGVIFCYSDELRVILFLFCVYFKSGRGEKDNMYCSVLFVYWC